MTDIFSFSKQNENSPQKIILKISIFNRKMNESSLLFIDNNILPDNRFELRRIVITNSFDII